MPLHHLDIRVGKHFAAARRAAQLTQAELAERCDVSTETIGRLERGTQVPTLARLDQIARALGVDLAEMVSERPPRDPAVRRLVALVTGRSADEIDLVTEIARVVLSHSVSDRSSKAVRRGG